MSIVVNGLTIARRGHPDIPKADTWVSLQPGWAITSSGDDGRMEVRIMYDGKPVVVHRACRQRLQLAEPPSSTAKPVSAASIRK